MEAEGGVTTEKEKAEGRERVTEPGWRDGGRRHEPRNAGDPQKRRGSGISPGVSVKNQPCQLLDFSPVRLTSEKSAF